MPKHDAWVKTLQLEVKLPFSLSMHFLPPPRGHSYLTRQGDFPPPSSLEAIKHGVNFVTAIMGYKSQSAFLMTGGKFVKKQEAFLTFLRANFAVTHLHLPPGTKTFPEGVCLRNCGSKSLSPPSVWCTLILPIPWSSPVCVSAGISRLRLVLGGTSGPGASSRGGGGMGGSGNVAETVA